MPDYCTLIIQSKNNSELPKKIFINKFLFKRTEESDHLPGILITNNENTLAKSPYYQKTFQWTITSQNFVKGYNLQSHISWILEIIDPNHSLLELREMGFEYILKFHWESNGTGAGPLLTYKTVKLLLRHGIDLQLQFHQQHYDSK